MICVKALLTHATAVPSATGGSQETCSQGRKSKNYTGASVRLIVVAMLIAAPLGAVSGLDISGARVFELQRDLRTVRPEVERAPRASSFQLKELQRRLHERRSDHPHDPRMQELAIELRHLRAKADRAARGPSAAALPRSSPLSLPAPIEKPRYLGGAHTPAAAPPARPYFGQRVVALQRSVAEIERRLAEGDKTAAARLLEAVEADLATLQGIFDSAVADDPNLSALEAQIRTLEKQLERN